MDEESLYDLWFEFGAAMQEWAENHLPSDDIDEWIHEASPPDACFLLISDLQSLMDNNGSFVDSIRSWENDEPKLLEAFAFFGMEKSLVLFPEAKALNEIPGYDWTEDMEKTRERIDEEVDCSYVVILQEVLRDPVRFSVDIREFLNKSGEEPVRSESKPEPVKPAAMKLEPFPSLMNGMEEFDTRVDNSNPAEEFAFEIPGELTVEQVSRRSDFEVQEITGVSDHGRIVSSMPLALTSRSFSLSCCSYIFNLPGDDDDLPVDFVVRLITRILQEKVFVDPTRFRLQKRPEEVMASAFYRFYYSSEDGCWTVSFDPF